MISPTASATPTPREPKVLGTGRFSPSPILKVPTRSPSFHESVSPTSSRPVGFEPPITLKTLGYFSSSEMQYLIGIKHKDLPPIYLVETLSPEDSIAFTYVFNTFSQDLYLYRIYNPKEPVDVCLINLKNIIESYKIKEKFKKILFCVIVNGSEIMKKEIEFAKDLAIKSRMILIKREKS